MDEIIIDLFCGGGGASTGIVHATGRHPDVAVNHDEEAVALHQVNHPSTYHLCQSVWRADPRDVAAGRKVGLLWASPDCKHFSKAKGGKPVAKNIRDLAWVVVHYAQYVRPRVILLENVEEFRDWGPLIEVEDGKLMPCPVRKGLTYRRWKRELQKLGYKIEERELRACDFGAPTTRKRLFVVARCDGMPIVWPAPTHAKDGKGGLLAYRTAAECIDWSIPCPSIFTRERPLAEATMRRIARGIDRYVINHADPFIVPLRGTSASHRSAHSIRDPLSTITGGGTHHALIAPTLIQTGYGEREGQAPRSLDLHAPLGTVVAGGAKHALVAAFLAQHNTGVVGHDAREPVSSITSKGCQQQLVKAFLLKYYGTDQDPELREPLHTITTKHRFGLVTVAGTLYEISDIGMRMLSPRELYRAQGFPDSYIIDHDGNGNPISKTAQIRMCGNSVCPPVAAALVAANYVSAGQERRTA